MRICQKCGAKCEDHVMFCHECGSPLGQNNGTMGGMESPYDNMQNNYGGQPNGNMGYGGNMYQSITPREYSGCRDTLNYNMWYLWDLLDD